LGISGPLTIHWTFLSAIVSKPFEKAVSRTSDLIDCNCSPPCGSKFESIFNSLRGRKNFLTTQSKVQRIVLTQYSPKRAPGSRMSWLAKPVTFQVVEGGEQLLFLSLRNSQRASVQSGQPSRRWACRSPLPASQEENVFPVSVFPPRSKQAKGWRLCRAGPMRFARPFQPTSFGRKSRNGRIPRSVVRPRLMMAHERRVGARQKRADCRKTTSAPWLERVSSPISTDGRQPFFPAASRNASLSRAYPSVPLFRGGNGRSSALIRAPPSSEVRT
jgi:hypothetical protein